MDIGQYVGDLQRQLLSAAENGSDETRAVAERLAAGLDSATRLVLLDALSDDPARDLAEMRDRAQRVLGPLCEVRGEDRLPERLFFLDARGALHARWDRHARKRILDEAGGKAKAA